MHTKKPLLVSAGLFLMIALVFSLSFTFFSYAGPAQAATFNWPLYGQGSTGENVYTIQYMLLAHGYSLSTDGIFGPQTAATVKSFQSAHNLGVDGIVGPQTWPVLIVDAAPGNQGSQVTAVQRQLNLNGAHLTVDGIDGSLTTAAVKSYQSSRGLSVDGIAGPQTWNNLVNHAPPVGKTPTPTPITTPTPTPSPGKILWGVDTTSTITQSYLSTIRSDYGNPAFIGRYIVISSATPISSSEVTFIHQQKIRILPIFSDYGNDIGYSQGVSRANVALNAAHALGIPRGVIIVADFEVSNNPIYIVDSNYIRAWYDTISKAGYKAGFYGNPLAAGTTQFPTAYCGAVSAESSIGNSSIVYSDEREPGVSSASHAPHYAPVLPSCKSQTLIWQYGQSTLVDTDELQSTVPIW